MLKIDVMPTPEQLAELTATELYILYRDALTKYGSMSKGLKGAAPEVVLKYYAQWKIAQCFNKAYQQRRVVEAAAIYERDVMPLEAPYFDFVMVE